MKVAIISQCISYFAGAERVVYELYNELTRQGIDVHLGTALLGDFYYAKLYPARVNDIPSCMDDTYDFIIAFHTHTFSYLFPDGVNCKKLFYFSLSPYEPIEFPFNQDDIIDSYLTNSFETREQLISSGITPEKINIFPNSAYFDLNIKTVKKRHNIPHRILIVSNHIPNELREISKCNCDIKFTIAGIDDSVSFIDSTFLQKFDAVITIGYTVVLAIEAKIPVYIYDHFGGDGWLNEHNFELNSKYNFSGRPHKTKKNTAEIIGEITNGFSDAIISIDNLYTLMKAERDIKQNLQSLLSTIPYVISYKTPTIYVKNSADAYFKLFKSNQNLQLLIIKKKTTKTLNITNITRKILYHFRKINNFFR